MQDLLILGPKSTGQARWPLPLGERAVGAAPLFLSPLAHCRSRDNFPHCSLGPMKSRRWTRYLTAQPRRKMVCVLGI